VKTDPRLIAATRLRTLDPFDTGSPSRGQGAAFKLLCEYPSSYHTGANAFNFADGHTELKRWLDPRTKPSHQDDLHLSTLYPGLLSPANPDVRWLQERATGRN
jgi:hypothetical protein